MQFTWFQCTQTALPGEGDLVSGADLPRERLVACLLRRENPAAGLSATNPSPRAPPESCGAKGFPTSLYCVSHQGVFGFRQNERTQWL